MNRKQLQENGYKRHHVGSKRGYVSRKSNIDDLPAQPYDGRFGTGYTVYMPRWDTTRYVIVEYWIRED